MYQREFPPHWLIRKTIVDIMIEHGGTIQIRSLKTGRTVYGEIARRLNVPSELAEQPTRGTGEERWRPEVGYCRKHLEQERMIRCTELSGRGWWELTEPSGWTKKGLSLIVPTDAELEAEVRTRLSFDEFSRILPNISAALARKAKELKDQKIAEIIDKARFIQAINEEMFV